MVTIVTPRQSLPEPEALPPDVLPPFRKKLPAFARPLLLGRRHGQHPHEVTVVFGTQWRGVPLPKVCVKPVHYAPGIFDWRVVAGVRAVLLDLAAGLQDFDVDADRYGPIYALIGELVDAQAFVVLRYPERGQWVERHADELAFACRRWVNGKSTWPSWWSEDRESRQRAALLGWIDDMERVITRRTAERGREK